jgi:hypothetical protein
VSGWKRSRSTLALLLAAGASLAADVRTAEQLLAAEPPELTERLRRERMLVLEDVGSGQDSFIVAFVLFAQPRARVTALLEQAERQPEYRPELKSVRTIERTPDMRIDEQHLTILFQDFVYRLRYQRNAEGDRLEWKLDPTFDNDLRQVEGFWELYDGRDGTTLGRFGSRVDVGPAVPAFVQKTLSRQTVLRYVENIRRWIDSEGSWRP